MNIPSTYIEWIDAIEYVKDHPRNDIYIENLNKGTLDYDDILIKRLEAELNNCIFYRMGKEVESFGNYIRGSLDYNSFSLKVVEIKKEFIYCKKIANIKILPSKIKEELNNAVMNNANRVQELLETQTEGLDKSGSINSIIKSNPINKLD